MKFTILVIKNLTRNKRRTILTVLSIAVSLFIFSALVSLPTVANEILADTASSTRIVTHNNFANSSAETQSESEAAFIGGFIKSYRMIFNLAEILGVIVVITIGLVAANTAAMSIRERRGEIAVMRSIGFSSRTILSLLLSESFVVGLLGGLVGCGSAFVVLHFVKPGVGDLTDIPMPPIILVETLIAAACIGLLSAWFPARAAARMNIVEALRMVA